MLECTDLQDILQKCFAVSSIWEMFESIDGHIVIDFVSKKLILSTNYCCSFIFLLIPTCSGEYPCFTVLLLSGTADEHYLSGFVGVCLVQYFCRKHPPTAYAVLLRLLTWKIVFTQTLPSRILKPVDVVEMAVKVSSDSVRAFCYACRTVADHQYQWMACVCYLWDDWKNGGKVGEFVMAGSSHHA